MLVLGSEVAAQLNVSQLDAKLRNGQVFVTWKEVPGAAVTYRVYRSETPVASYGELAGAQLLGEVNQASSLNKRNTLLAGGVPDYYRVEDLADPLQDDDGLFVHTVAANAQGYYTVTVLDSGIEETVIAAGDNTTVTPVDETPERPRPVLQRVTGVKRDYVHWVSNQQTPFAPAMWMNESQAYNLRVMYDPTVDPGPRPVLVHLHYRSGNYQHEPEPTHPEAVVVSPDDWFDGWPNVTYWFGANPLYPNVVDYPTAQDQDYTVRRVLFELEFAQSEFPCDPARVYALGVSMGAVGASFLTYAHPEKFAAAQVALSKFDMGCQDNGCWFEPAAGYVLWGTPEQLVTCNEGLIAYDRLDLGYMGSMQKGTALPFLLSLDGRQDELFGWTDKPPTYNALQQARQPGAFLWDNGTHAGSNPTAGGLWTATWYDRYEEMWRYRLDQPQPALTNASLDSNEGNGDPLVGDLIGSLNGYIGWDTSTIVDEGAQHSLVAFLRTGTGPDAAPASEATVDWTPRRLQQFALGLGEHLRFRNYEGAKQELVDDRIVTVDTTGLATVPAARVTIDSNRWTLERVSLPGSPGDDHPPFLLGTGLYRVGTFVDLNVFGPPGGPCALWWGTQLTDIPIEPFGGALQTADPVYHGHGFIGLDGKKVFHIPVTPAMAAIVGFPIHFQAFSGFSFTNVEDVVIQN